MSDKISRPDERSTIAPWRDATLYQEHPEPLLYVCHPVAPYFDEATQMAYLVETNVENARAWTHWLRALTSDQRDALRLPRDALFFCPWLDDVAHGNDADPAARAAGLHLDQVIARRCDAVVLVGGRISSGMALEAEACGYAYDLTHLGRRPDLAIL